MEQLTGDTPKYMYKDFEEYAEILGIDKYSPQWEAFKVVWDMARTPYGVLEQMSEQLNKKGALNES